MGSLHAQNGFIEPVGRETETDYDPCADGTLFPYAVPLPNETSLCDQFPNFTPSPGCTIANGTTTIYGPNELVTGKNYLVQGLWTINTNNSLIFQNCNFKMAPGALIKLNCVNNLNTTFTFCKFFSCDQMWRGITVQHNFGFGVPGVGQTPAFNFLNCFVEDASTALQFLQPSLLVQFDILGNNFNNNFVALEATATAAPPPPGTVSPLHQMRLRFSANVVGTTGNLRTYYQVPSPSPWPLAQAGMIITGINVIFPIGSFGMENTFKRISTGILGRGSVLDIQHNEFSTIWQNGIFAGACDLTIHDNDFIGEITLPNGDPVLNIMSSGINASGCDARIANNEFTRRIRIGIWSQQNLLGQRIEILYNVFGDAVGMAGVALPIGIRLERSAATASLLTTSHNVIQHNEFYIEAPNYTAINVVGANTTDDVLFVDANSPINLTNTNDANWIRGIRIATQNGENFRVQDNRVHIMGFNKDQTNYGIQLFTASSDNFIVLSNFVEGDASPAPADPLIPQSLMCAIRINNDAGSHSTICNNLTTASCHGVHCITGSAELTENEFRDHTDGVFLQSGSEIGIQAARGNQWTGSYLRYAASVSDGSNPYLHTRFLVSESNTWPFLPPGASLDPNPDLALDLDQKWFLFNPTLPTQSCSEEYESPTLDEFDFNIAAGVTFDLTTPQIWDARRSLFRKLLEHPSLASGNSTLQSFQSAFQNTSVAAFAQVDVAIRNATRISAAVQQSRDSLSLSITQNTDQSHTLLAAVNFNLASASPAQVQSLNNFANQVVTANASRQALDIAQEQQIASLLTTANTLNEALQPANTQEQARKDLNRLKVHAADATPGSQSDYQAALVLAGQSEALVGANAREAQLLLSGCDQETFTSHDEYSGVERTQNHPSELSSETSANMSVHPNPSDGRFQVVLNTPINGFLSLTDASGKLINRMELTLDQKNITFNAANAPVGLYFLILTNSDGKIVETVRTIIR